MKTVSEIGEFGLIERIARLVPVSPTVIEGIGDDCAVVRVADSVLLVSADMFIEDVHFKRSYAEPEDIGWKATAAGLSDIAAMGGKPLVGLVALACPADTEVRFVEKLYGGVANMLSRYGAAIVGGDTCRSFERITIDITVLGEAQGSRFLRRKGARAGDLLVISGCLGESAAGLHAIEHDRHVSHLISAHLRPHPRISEGQWLAGHQAIHAMIDLSDGLLQDAGHLAAAGQLGVNIDPERLLTTSPNMRQYCEAQGLDPLELMLAGGEDYELAFALDPTSQARSFHEFHHEFRTPLNIVGEFTDEWSGVRVAGAPTELSGYDHFTRGT